MHKKLEAELVSLAHSILALKNNKSIEILYTKAQAVFEKLTIAKYLNEQKELEEKTILETQEEFVEIETKFNKEMADEIVKKTENEQDNFNKASDFEEIKFSISEDKSTLEKEENLEKSTFKTSLEEEFKDAISATEASKIFDNVTKENPVISEENSFKNRTLNDALFKNNLQIGLNDRIAFVNQLFDGSQEDFNRVISQLNTFNNEEDAKFFVLHVVKPDYDWSTKLEFEERLLTLIERKFL